MTAPIRRRSRTVIRMLAFTALWLAVLFGGAGTLDWVRGWIYVYVYVAGMALIGLVMRRFNPDLVEARLNWRRKDTKPFDKAFLGIFLPLTLIQLVVAGMEVVRFGGSGMPGAALFGGIALMFPATALIAWTVAVNRHAETTVRIQTDRGHTVVTSGPYRYVRHPMYVGAILLYVATPLILGSWWALAVAGGILVLFLWRTAMEDRTLRRELAGYAEYAARTRYRLLPGVW